MSYIGMKTNLTLSLDHEISFGYNVLIQNFESERPVGLVVLLDKVNFAEAASPDDLNELEVILADLLRWRQDVFSIALAVIVILLLCINASLSLIHVLDWDLACWHVLLLVIFLLWFYICNFSWV